MEERELGVVNGWPMLLLTIFNWLAVPAFFFLAARYDAWHFGAAGLILILTALFFNFGLFMVQPNEARVLVLFGKYAGTVRENGFYWANPFSIPKFSGLVYMPGKEAQGRKTQQSFDLKNKYRVSLRMRNFQTETLKVNDQRGNPVEIGAVVVWRVVDTAKALFDVEAYEDYVHIQSEAALRHLASSYPYDHMTDDPMDELTLLGSGDVINAALITELEERLSRAGVAVVEARLMHLAYAQEIAGAMLRRQQAEAIIAARKKIVAGAVGMVEMALKHLSENRMVELNDERKAAMISNLLVVLCGEKEAEPVINTGTLNQP